ncbi:MAG: ATP-binding protein [Rhodocyclaceae bacterium]
MNPTAMARVPDGPDTRWRSLHYFNLYRLSAALVFLVAALLQGGGAAPFVLDRPLFFATDIAYCLAALAFVATHRRRWLPFDWLLTAQVLTDIVALTLLMHASGGLRGGVAIMIVVVLAGAGLVGQGRLSVFYAAMATLAVLAEQGLRMLLFGAEAAEFIPVGTTSIGFFATAISARLLAQRVSASAALARARGVALDNQLRVNQYIIRDMADGVLVVDADASVRQFNPRACELLDRPLLVGTPLADVSPALAARFERFRAAGEQVAAPLPSPPGAASVRARFVRPAEGGDALVYLEDLGRIQAQAQQLKLAALGRLTAGIAHEVRNPLAAISHAAELLREDAGGESQPRLTAIIADNARRLDRMVRDVLELGRRDRVQPESIRLEPYLHDFVDAFCRHEGAPRALFRLDVRYDSTMRFDRGHLDQVLWNLLANARRYCSGREGAVQVSVRADEVRGRCELDVVDDGPGIPDEVRAQVFDPFFTTHTHGTGLGLYIARELCEANRAVLESLPGPGGAHFRISAPGAS